MENRRGCLARRAVRRYEQQLRAAMARSALFEFGLRAPGVVGWMMRGTSCARRDLKAQKSTMQPRTHCVDPNGKDCRDLDLGVPAAECQRDRLAFLGGQFALWMGVHRLRGFGGRAGLG